MVNQKLIYHAVIFDHRQQTFLESVDQNELHEFLNSWCRQTGLDVLSIGWHSNHLHLLFEQVSELSLQYLMKLIVRKMEEWLRGFESEIELDFGIFTVSYSAIDKIKRFVESQEAHHAVVSFEEEFVSLLDKHHVVQDNVSQGNVSQDNIIQDNIIQDNVVQGNVMQDSAVAERIGRHELAQRIA